VTGAGDKAFSAGNDLRYTAEHSRTAFPMLLKEARRLCWHHLTLRHLQTDHRGGQRIRARRALRDRARMRHHLAADHARFGLPEPRVGLMRVRAACIACRVKSRSRSRWA